MDGNTVIKDFRGTEYGVGSIIVYAGKSYGSAVYLTEATVEAINSKQIAIGHNEYYYALDGESWQVPSYYDMPAEIRANYKLYGTVRVDDGFKTVYSLKARRTKDNKAVNLTSLYHVVAIPGCTSAI